jgi:hypothetical protein
MKIANWFSSHRLTRSCPHPPPLAADHDRASYAAFMKEEMQLYSGAYAKKRVKVAGKHCILDASRHASIVLGLLHHGSWILIGGVLRHVLHLPYTVIASRRNFDVMPDDESAFWREKHKFIAGYYRAPLLYSDQSPREALAWLRKPGQVLGVAFDVREHEKSHRECQVEFAGHRLWAQISPARIARISRSLIVPASIHYSVESRQHELTFHDAIDPRQFGSDSDVVQKVYSTLESNYMQYPQQGFNDIVAMFGAPHG